MSIICVNNFNYITIKCFNKYAKSTKMLCIIHVVVFLLKYSEILSGFILRNGAIIIGICYNKSSAAMHRMNIYKGRIQICRLIPQNHS
jgi:hypothetical protein